MKFSIITNFSEAKKYWDMFSPKKVLYDSWDFRYCFYKYDNYPLYFIVGFENDSPVGLLPLQFNTEKKYLEFFGGYYMEDNRVFLDKIYEDNGDILNEFFSQITTKARLKYMSKDCNPSSSVQMKSYKYILPLEKYSNTEDYLKKNPSKSLRKHVKHAVREINTLKIAIFENRKKDIEDMFRLSIQYFGTESSFNWPHRKEIFRDFFSLPSPMKTFVLSYEINNQLEGVQFSIDYNNILYALNSGLNLDPFPELKRFAVLHLIQRAIENKKEKIDFCVGSYGWKHTWHFDKVPQYKFYKD